MDRDIFLKFDGANRSDQPTSQKSKKMDNFRLNCLIWMKFGEQVSFTSPYQPEKFRSCRSIILLPSPTNQKADL